MQVKVIGDKQTLGKIAGQQTPSSKLGFGRGPTSDKVLNDFITRMGNDRHHNFHFERQTILIASERVKILHYVGD